MYTRDGEQAARAAASQGNNLLSLKIIPASMNIPSGSRPENKAEQSRTPQTGSRSRNAKIPQK